MQCPLDGETLMMTHRSGIEIDYCPKCRGVWLDRGELDKIVDMAARDVGAAQFRGADQPRGGAPAAMDPYADRRNGDDHHRNPDYRDRDRDDHRRGGRKRRESFLSELFDFD